MAILEPYGMVGYLILNMYQLYFNFGIFFSYSFATFSEKK